MFKLLQAVEHASNHNCHRCRVGPRPTSGKPISKEQPSTSLVAQRTQICLPMQGTWVRFLAWEDSTRRKATKPDLGVRKIPCRRERQPTPD